MNTKQSRRLAMKLRREHEVILMQEEQQEEQQEYFIQFMQEVLELDRETSREIYLKKRAEQEELRETLKFVFTFIALLLLALTLAFCFAELLIVFGATV